MITKHDAMECTAMVLSHPTMTDIVAGNNMEDLRMAEERAAIADTALGADILRANLQQDDNRRSQFARQFDNPFNQVEQAIYDAAPPPYSEAEIEADAEHDLYKCPILCDIPEPEDIVKWQGHYYSIQALRELCSKGPTDREYIDGTQVAIPIFRNPMTNAQITQQEFFGGELPLSQRRQAWVQKLIDDYAQHSSRRRAYHHYKTLLPDYKITRS